jgi:hypothetical protein
MVGTEADTTPGASGLPVDEVVGGSFVVASSPIRFICVHGNVCARRGPAVQATAIPTSTREVTQSSPPARAVTVLRNELEPWKFVAIDNCQIKEVGTSFAFLDRRRRKFLMRTRQCFKLSGMLYAQGNNIGKSSGMKYGHVTLGNVREGNIGTDEQPM